MRPCFSDITTLKQIAKREVEQGLGKLRNWWASKYTLPTNHELFMSRSIGSLNIEMFEDLYVKRSDLERSLETASGKENGSIVRQINEINAILEEETYVDDPLIDKWERELAEGKIPDLEEK